MTRYRYPIPCNAVPYDLVPKDFWHPLGMAIDSLGNIYVVDGLNHHILKLSAGWDILLFWGAVGDGAGQFWEAGMGWDSPINVAIDNPGNVYVTDGRSIQKFTPDGQFLEKWETEHGSDEQIHSRGIALDDSGNIYVTSYRGDIGDHCIQKFTSTGEIITKLGGEFGSGDGEFYCPKDVAVDKYGNIYVADSGNCRIQKFASDGRFLTKWGKRDRNYLADGMFTLPDDGGFRYPNAITVGSSGTLYVVDSGSSLIQEFTPDGDFLAKWGCQYIYTPRGVAVDNSENLYVTSLGSIKKFAPDGKLLRACLKRLTRWVSWYILTGL